MRFVVLTFLSLYATACVLTFLSIYASALMASAAQPLVVATRLHLGHAAHPPSSGQLRATLSAFARLAATVRADHAVVAVDAAAKFDGFDLVAEVTQICRALRGGEAVAALHVLAVAPWGKFVPALNAIVSWSAQRDARYLLLASAEVQMTPEVLAAMKRRLDLETTLVVGTALQGHDYRAPGKGGAVEVPLTGRTTPWNTHALWNVPKLALTGFLLVSEGLHPGDDGREGPAGVEEACTIATLQRILQPQNAQAKLVSIPGATWEQEFEDEKRREWHERKMLSKFTRAQRQLDLLGLTGTVLHC